MYRKDQPQTIQSLFNQIASRYDITNLVVSFSLHKYWNRALVKAVQKKQTNHIYYDLCAGTGDIAFDYLRMAKHACDQAYLIDFSSEMLNIARAKEKKYNLNAQAVIYLQSDVQEIALKDSSADTMTMAYGIRNVENPKKCLKEVHRLLKPKGVFGILELTRPSNRILRWGHQLYLKTLLPLLVLLITKNRDAYAYLSQSVDTFISPDTIKKLMVEEGFQNVSSRSLSGGIATLIIGYKN